MIYTTEEVYKINKNGKNKLIIKRPYIFKRLFAAGQTFIENSIKYKVISCSIKQDGIDHSTVTTVVEKIANAQEKTI